MLNNAFLSLKQNSLHNNIQKTEKIKNIQFIFYISGIYFHVTETLPNSSIYYHNDTFTHLAQ